MGDDKINKDKLNEKFDQIKKESNIGGKQFYNTVGGEEIKVQLIPDKSVSPAKFKPHPNIKGAFLAHPTTIAAVKKDIFSGADSIMEELVELVPCHSCNRQLDKQFWNFCPHCEAAIKN